MGRSGLAGVSGDEQVRRARQSATDTDQTDQEELALDGLTPDEARVLKANPAAADAFFDEGLAYNLDEVAPEPVHVALYEYRPVEEEDEDGTTHTVRRLYRRRYTIETRVPMRLFNRMLSGRRRVMQRRKTFLAGGGAAETEDDPMLLWMQQQVLAVWQLTDPEMTLERLADGLTFAQIQGLFARFFGEQLRPR